MQYARLASDYFPETWKMSRLLRCSPYARNIVAKKNGPGIRGQVWEKLVKNQAKSVIF
jgi:hypothetical protein